MRWMECHMDNDYPNYLYKYRAVKTPESLSQDYSIDALFKCQAIFSGRKNFNDLFDSKINLIFPTQEQIQELAKQPSFRKFVDNGQTTKEGLNFINNAQDRLNKLIDSYSLFSLSKNSRNNLMWSHYADSHKGFCIEFKSDYIKADKVSYEDEIPQIEIIDFLNEQGRVNLSNTIWRSLRTKLREWDYEDEYRFQPGGSLPEKKLPDGEKFVTIPYDPQCVESIIFGCRTPEPVKTFITKNYPYKVKLKRAIELMSSIEIIDIN